MEAEAPRAYPPRGEGVGRVFSPPEPSLPVDSVDALKKALYKEVKELLTPWGCDRAKITLEGHWAKVEVTTPHRGRYTIKRSIKYYDLRKVLLEDLQAIYQSDKGEELIAEALLLYTGERENACYYHQLFYDVTPILEDILRDIGGGEQ